MRQKIKIFLNVAVNTEHAKKNFKRRTYMNLKKNYEDFVRKAFGSSHGVDMSAEPARLADIDPFKEENINGVKAAVSYSMEIYKIKLMDQYKNYNSMEKEINLLIDKVIHAADLFDVSGTIFLFREMYLKGIYLMI